MSMFHDLIQLKSPLPQKMPLLKGNVFFQGEPKSNNFRRIKFSIAPNHLEQQPEVSYIINQLFETRYSFRVESSPHFNWDHDYPQLIVEGYIDEFYINRNYHEFCFMMRSNCIVWKGDKSYLP